MIQLRKKHPAFRMGDADLVRKHLEFLPVDGILLTPMLAVTVIALSCIMPVRG